MGAHSDTESSFFNESTIIDNEAKNQSGCKQGKKKPQRMNELRAQCMHVACDKSLVCEWDSQQCVLCASLLKKCARKEVPRPICVCVVFIWLAAARSRIFWVQFHTKSRMNIYIYCERVLGAFPSTGQCKHVSRLWWVRGAHRSRSCVWHRKFLLLPRSQWVSGDMQVLRAPEFFLLSRLHLSARAKPKLGNYREKFNSRHTQFD